jgi:hypothetical protein
MIYLFSFHDEKTDFFPVLLNQERFREDGYYTVKRVDEVVRHLHLVTQDQFTQVSKKVSNIPEENFTINIKLFRHFSQVIELVRCDYISHVELFR